MIWYPRKVESQGAQPLISNVRLEVARQMLRPENLGNS
jgi:hypothetical protein